MAISKDERERAPLLSAVMVSKHQGVLNGSGGYYHKYPYACRYAARNQKLHKQNQKRACRTLGTSTLALLLLLGVGALASLGITTSPAALEHSRKSPSARGAGSRADDASARDRDKEPHTMRNGTSLLAIPRHEEHHIGHSSEITEQNSYAFYSSAAPGGLRANDNNGESSGSNDDRNYWDDAIATIAATSTREPRTGERRGALRGAGGAIAAAAGSLDRDTDKANAENGRDSRKDTKSIGGSWSWPWGATVAGTSGDARGVNREGSGDRPNVFFFMVNDMGWDDVGYQSTDLSAMTPRLNALAASGVKV